MLIPLLAIAAVAAPITAVTVHQGYARVVRTAALAVSGRHTVELPPLPARADPATVRLEAEGAEVQSIELRRTGAAQPSPTPEIERIDKAIASTERQQALFAALAGVTSWKPEPPDETPPPGKLDPRAWRGALAFLDRFAERMDLGWRALDRQLHGQRAERTRLAAGVGPAANGAETWQVVATVAGSGSARLQVSYLVPDATWRPVYEVRLDPSKEQVSLALSAVVIQQTGEDWPEARLTLSTAHPTRFVAPPRLTAWRIGDPERFVPAARPIAPGPPATLASPEPRPAGPGMLVGYIFDQTGAPLAGVKVAIQPPPAGKHTTYTDQQGRFEFSKLPPGPYQVTATAPKLRTVMQKGIQVSADRGAEANLVMETASAVEEVRVVERTPLVSTTHARIEQSFDMAMLAATPRAPARRPPLSLAPPVAARPAAGPEVSFAALLPDTIPSGPAPRRIPLRSWSLPVTLQRTMAPGLAPEAYLVAKLRNPGDGRITSGLPAGQAALFVGDDPAGTTELQAVAPGQALELPTGVDRDLRAIRRVTVATHQEGIFRRREVARYTVTIDITNPHPRPLRLTLHDQIPIAGDGAVESRLRSAAPAAGWDPRTGALTWQLDLRPGQIAHTTFSYELRYPKGQVVRQEGGAR
jgi:hypothetical protein